MTAVAKEVKKLLGNIPEQASWNNIMY